MMTRMNINNKCWTYYRMTILVNAIYIIFWWREKQTMTNVLTSRVDFHWGFQTAWGARALVAPSLRPYGPTDRRVPASLGRGTACCRWDSPPDIVMAMQSLSLLFCLCYICANSNVYILTKFRSMNSGQRFFQIIIGGISNKSILIG